MRLDVASVAVLLACAFVAGCTDPSPRPPSPTTTDPASVDPLPTPTPTPTVGPTEPPTPTPTLEAGYGAGVTGLTFYGIGEAVVGDTVDQVESDLGIELTTVIEEYGSCMAVLDRTGSVGVVLDGGVAQAFLVRASGLWLEQVAAAPVEVGDPFSALDDAYPDEFLYAGPSEYPSMFDGPRATISPSELAGALLSQGRSVNYGADPQGIVAEIRVGSTSYVDQLTYCQSGEE